MRKLRGTSLRLCPTASPTTDRDLLAERGPTAVRSLREPVPTTGLLQTRSPCGTAVATLASQCRTTAARHRVARHPVVHPSRGRTRKVDKPSPQGLRLSRIIIPINSRSASTRGTSSAAGNIGFQRRTGASLLESRLAPFAFDHCSLARETTLRDRCSSGRSSPLRRASEPSPAHHTTSCCSSRLPVCSVAGKARRWSAAGP